MMYNLGQSNLARTQERVGEAWCSVFGSKKLQQAMDGLFSKRENSSVQRCIIVMCRLLNTECNTERSINHGGEAQVFMFCFTNIQRIIILNNVVGPRRMYEAARTSSIGLHGTSSTILPTTQGSLGISHLGDVYYF